MSAWIVFSKDGLTQKCEVRSLQYSGEFLGACSITAKIVSPTPIDFEIGDYLEYRGERFEINYDPTVVKQASSGSYGEGFVYDNIVFNSLSDELTRCDFLDYVPKDNLLHYSSLPTFSFFADSVEKLAERIQVNLDRIYTGDKKWTVTVHPDFNGKKDVNIAINNQTCWDALALVKNEFDGNFIIKGRNITIGTEGIALESVFSYGKGNGLISIERNAESDQKIITRLRAYGSTRNLPEHYYKNVGLKAFGEVIWLVDRDATDHVRCYLNIPYDSKLFKQKGDSHEVKVRVNGIEASATITEHTAKDEFEGCCELYSQSSELASVVIDGVKAYFTAYVNEDEFPKANKEYADFVPNNMAINHLMLPSFPDETIDPYIDSENIEALGIREATVFFDGSGEQEEIYPSMTGMTAEDLQAAGVECKATGALDEVVDAEFVNDDGFYKEGSTTEPFTITLKDIGFDINDHFSTDNPSITMNSGMCGGREFEIVSCRREGVNYILTCNRHYDQSLDLYFPYKDFPIRGGDKFVLLNIEMPDVYVKAASQRLLTAAKWYLGNNDYVRYSYSPKVDNLFMARQHDEAKKFGLASIYETIKEGDLMLFNDTDLRIEGSVIIDSLTIKEGDSLIPEYEITLRNNKTVGTITKIQNQIDSIVSGNAGSQGGGYNASQIKSLITSYGSTLFLRKDKDDRSKGKIASDKAIEVGNYVSGASGAIIYNDAETGQTVGEMDKLYIRMKAYFETLEIINANTIGGKQIISPAGSVKCIGVEELENAYRCYFLAEQDGEKVQNRFVAGDQIYSQMFDAVEGTSHNVSTHYLWRLCTGSSKEAVEFEGKKCHYLDLSITDCDKDSDVPSVGDVLNQRGNRTDLDRMNFIEQSSVDAFSPNITLFHGVNSYSLVGKEYVSYGVDKSTNKAFMNVYGDMYVGDRNGGSYMRYTQEDGLEISGRLSVDTKLGDSTLKDLISASSPEGYQEFVEKVTQDIEGLQAQIDGAIESYFFQYDPTLGNYPASEWITEEQKKAHLNDTFTNLNSGYSWRWSLDGTTYKWVEITDTATSKALALAGQAQDTADGKRRVFVNTPTTPYDKGDLWSRGSEYPLMICVKTKDKNGVYEASDFDYADNNAKLKEEMQDLVGTTKDELNNAIGQATEAANKYADQGISEAKKAIDDSIDDLNKVKANVEDVYSKAEADGIIEQKEQDAIKAANEAAKAAIALSEELVKAYADGIVDDEEAARIKQAEENLQAAKDYADQKAQEAFNAIAWYEYLADALLHADGTEIQNGLVLTSLIQLRDKNGNIMSGINALTSKGDRSIANWWGGDMLDMTDYCQWNGKEWVVKPNNTMPASVSSGLIRMDGTGYLAKGKFWWDNEGKIYADPRALFLMFDVNEEAADLSTTILAMRDKQTEFESMWRFETDKNGQKYLYSTYPLVTQGSISMMSGNGASVPSIFDGIPIDGTTIYWENGVLKAQGGGGTITEVTSAMVVNALGYTPYDASNPSGFITNSALNGYATQGWVNNQGFLTQHQDLSGYQPLISTSNKLSYSLISGTPSLATVATSGSYSDLIGKPSLLSSFTNDLGFITSSALSDYLPKSGGTISGSLTLGTSDNTSWIQVGFQRNGVDGFIGMSNDGMMEFGRTQGFIRVSQDYFRYNKYSVDYDVLHSGNYSDYALPLSGGTILGSYGALNIKRNNENSSLILFSNTTGKLGYLGMESVNKPAFWTTDVSVKFLLHEDNFNDYAPTKTGTGATGTWGISISGNAATASNAGDAQILSTTKASGITNDVTFKRGFLPKANYTDGNWGSPTGAYNSGEYAMAMRFADGEYYHELWFNLNESEPYWRQVVNGVSKGWRKFAFTDSNVSSATKLQTARSIFGHLFDGTSNVSGDIWEVGDINTHSSYSDIYIKLNTDSRSWWTGIGINSGDDKYIIYDATAQQHRLSIDTSGNVGIGTTNPKYKLDVNGFARALQFQMDDSNSSNSTPQSYWAIYGWDKRLSFTTRNASNYWTSEPLCILYDTGNVGIGTQTPSYKLDVSGSAYIGTTDEGICISRYGNTIDAISNNGSSLPLYLNHTSTGDVRMVIGGGNVGIGTTNPTSKLHVEGDARINGSIWGATCVVSNDTDGYFVGNRKQGMGSSDGGLMLYTYGNTPISIFTGGSERMYIKSDGNIGIGTSNPYCKFHVSTASDWAIVGEGTHALAYMGHYAGYGLFVGTKRNISSYYLLHLMYGQTTLGVDGSTAMIVKADGNVGIGTDNPYYKLDVSGDIHNTTNIFSNGAFLAASGSEGAYLHGTGISWHNSSNIWTKDLFTYSNDVDTLTAHKALRCYSTLTIDGTTYHSSPIWINGSQTRGSYPSIVLHIPGYTYAQFCINEGGTTELRIGNSQSGQFMPLSVGSFTSNGNILCTGSITMNSMRSLKNIVDERGLSLEELSLIKPTRFTWKDGRDDRLHIGGIADDVMNIMPEVVFKGSDGVLSMDYASAAFAIGASLIKPVSEHEHRIAALERENELLKEEIRNLKSA